MTVALVFIAGMFAGVALLGFARKRAGLAWTNVDERLPDETVDVLVHDYEGVSIGWQQGGLWYVYDKESMEITRRDGVKEWMVLPYPPRY